MGRPKTNWTQVAEWLNYKSEKDMWDDLYVKQGMSGNGLDRHLGYNADSIRGRLRELGYVIKPKGGVNHTGLSISKYRDKLLNARNTIKDLTVWQIHERYGISINHFKRLAKAHGILYKKGRYQRLDNYIGEF